MYVYMSIVTDDYAKSTKVRHLKLVWHRGHLDRITDFQSYLQLLPRTDNKLADRGAFTRDFTQFQ